MPARRSSSLTAGEILGDETIEQHAEHVALEVPAVHAAAQVVGDAPDGLVQLGAFGFFVVCHLTVQLFLLGDLCRQEQQQRIIRRGLETEAAIVPGGPLIERIDEQTNPARLGVDAMRPRQGIDQ